MKRTGATDSLDTMVSPKTPKIRQNPRISASGRPWALGPTIPPYFPFGTVSAAGLREAQFTLVLSRTGVM